METGSDGRKRLDLEEIYSRLSDRLPRWRQYRSRWPLWTGDREAWSGREEEWPDRIAWTPQTVATVSLGSKPPETLKRSPVARARHAALALFSAPEIPADLEDALDGRGRLLHKIGWGRQLEDPEAGLWTGWQDREEIGRSLCRALFRRPDGDASLLTRFLSLRLARAAGGADEEPKESPEKLAVELCRSVGLVGRAGRSTGLSPETLYALDQEARQIVDDLRDGPIDEELRFVVELAEPSGTVDLERRRRWLKGKREEPPPADTEAALQIRFPFLFRRELNLARDSQLTPVEAAYRLVDHRLLGSHEYSTYRRKLSEGNHEDGFNSETEGG